jgi:hypothetical protein
MSIEDILLQQVRENVDRAKRTKETSMEYAPSPGQMANFTGMLAPGAGYADFFGEYPSLPSYDQPVTEAFSNEPYPSFAENLQRGGFGGYFDASMQGLGMAGDTLYAAPVVGPPLGGMIKGLGAFGAVMRAGSKAGKGAKTEEGIATLGKQPMFTPEDTLNLAYTPDGSYSPGIKDLIEKASPKLRGQGIVQWANKNLKPKELEVLGIEEFIKANPKATLKETVEGISGNKVVVGKKVLGGGEGQIMDFDITEPIDDPLTGAVLWDDIIGDTIYQLDDGDQYIQEDLVNYFNTLRAEKFVETGSEKGIPDKIYEFDEITGDKLEQLGLGKGSSMALDDLIESYAEAQYMSNPYELIRPTGVNVGDNTFAFGNEDVGYSLFVDGRRMEGYDVPYSQTEAQIQLRGAMAEEGYDMFRLEADDYDDAFDGFGGETQYKGFMDKTLPGGKNYREIIYTYEGADETHNLAHSGLNPDEGNYLAHALVRDRKLADGTETLHGDELQSDLHKRYKDGYRTPEKVEEINSELRIKEQEILKQADIVEDMLIKKGLYTKQDPIEPSIFNTPDNNPNLTRNDYINNYLTTIRSLGKPDSSPVGGTTTYDDVAFSASELRDFLRNQQVPKDADTYNPLTDFQFTDAEFESIYDLSKITGQTNKLNSSIEYLVPNYPYKDDYHEMMVKKLLLQAVEEGKPAISISGSAPIKARYESGNVEMDKKNFAFYEKLYDKQIPSSMDKLAKKYGGEFQKNSKLDMKDTFGEGYLELAEGLDNRSMYTAMQKKRTDEAIASLDTNVIKITEEMRNKLLLEGIPDFAIGGIVNKGIATLRTAKQPTEGIVDLGLY